MIESGRESLNAGEQNAGTGGTGQQPIPAGAASLNNKKYFY